MAAKTTNEMIYATLRTKADKPAKYAEQLRELGYEVEDTATYGTERTYERSYWAVNGLEVDKCEGETAQLSLGRGQYVEKFENIKRIDFVDYFAKLEGRRAKAERMAVHDEIEQRHVYYGVKRFNVKVRDGEGRYDWHYEARVRRDHRIIDENHVVSEYRALKRKADASGRYGWGELEEDHEIRFAERMHEQAEARVEKLRKELEAAEREAERRKADVQKAIDEKAEGRRELNAWLVARGIRKEVA